MAASNARGMPACFLGSAQHDQDVVAGAWAGEYQLVYLTPELATRSVDCIKRLNATAVRSRSTPASPATLPSLACCFVGAPAYKPE